MARCDRISFSGNKDYSVEIDIKDEDDAVIFTLLYDFNDLPFNIINPARYNVRYPDGTLDKANWYNSTNELGNNPHEASREVIVDGVAYKLIYGTFYEDLDPTKDVIFSLSEAEPVSYHMEPDASDLDDPSVLNVLTYNPGILMPLAVSDQEEDKRAAVFYKAMPKNMDFIIFQEFFDPVQSRRIINSLLPYYPYKTSIVNDIQILPGIVLGGGVMVMSKHPILEEDDFSFKNDGTANAIGLNALANKGVKYAKIDKHGQIIHVFGTHTHGFTSDNNDMGRWIQDKLDPNRDDVVIMGGDMNTGAYGGGYRNMMDTLNAAEPTYLTLTNEFRQRGTVWKDNHFIAPGNGAPGSIDFLFANSTFKVPVVSYNDVQAYRLNSTDRDFWGIYDLGDHQPVYGRFEFPTIEDQSSDTEVCPGEDLQLLVSTSLSDFDVEWYHEDELLEGEHQLILNRPAIEESQWGNYRCEVLYSYAPDEAINGGDPFTTPYQYPGETVGKLVKEFEIMPDIGTCRLAAQSFLSSRTAFNMFPNPATDWLTLNTKGLSGQLTIHNTTGDLIYQEKISTDHKVDVSNWLNGVYVASIFSDDQLSFEGNFVVQHQ